MNKEFHYYDWFSKLISGLISIFLILSVFAVLYVFSSVFEGITRYLVFFIVLSAYLLVVCFFKDKVLQIIKKIYISLKKIDSKKLLLILCLMMIVLKIIYTVFFYFDATQDGDIKIYNDIAESIVRTGSISSSEISHLVGMGLHLAVFKYIGIPIHIGLFIAFFIGTIINYLSFKDIVGKEKTFMVIFVYLLMPSTMLFTFCPTHELFVYLYLSISIFALNRFMKTIKTSEKFLYAFLLIVFSVLTCFVNPAGYIIYIIIVLSVLLSNSDLLNKVVLIVVLVLSTLLSNLLTNQINPNQFNTTVNTYAILVQGSSMETMGEQMEEHPVRQVLFYLDDNNLPITEESVISGIKNMLIEQYKYLITHPVELVKLLAHKFFRLWSGDYYAVELAYYYNAFNSITYYIMLICGALLYLFMITISVVFKKETSETYDISNYQLLILGVFGVTILSVLLNKYRVYVTLFLYLVTIYRTEIEE